MKMTVSTILFVLVFVSAILIVMTQHNYRKTFMDIQKLEAVKNDLNEEWGKLQLEQSTWATDDRIERLAREKLNMESPATESIVLIAK
ncbi:MAG: cell division protein FtsL [Gammaproteobacteria bacterium]|nr:cell division protein FtsL [Gammaproteobacteria bacterium]